MVNLGIVQKSVVADFWTFFIYIGVVSMVSINEDQWHKKEAGDCRVDQSGFVSAKGRAVGRKSDSVGAKGLAVGRKAIRLAGKDFQLAER